MKIFISSDLEGTAGIVDWEQCIAGGADYALGRELLLGEVNAAIEGALAAGATDIVVNDSHSVMQNLDPRALAGKASYLSGRHKPMYMLEGLDDSFDAVFFLSYHGAMASASTLSHTYSPGAIAEVRIDGTPAGESGINALVAAHFGVPVALITGDQYVGREAEPFCPGIVHVQVKESVSRTAALSLHPEVARERIRDGAYRAVRGVADGDVRAPAPTTPPATIEIDTLTADHADVATWIRGVERTGRRTVTLRAEDGLTAYRSFVAVLYLLRALAERR